MYCVSLLAVRMSLVAGDQVAVDGIGGEQIFRSSYIVKDQNESTDVTRFLISSMSTQASAMPASMACFMSGERLPTSRVRPAPTSILANRAISSVSACFIALSWIAALIEYRRYRWTQLHSPNGRLAQDARPCADARSLWNQR